jgi:hypothetical protein
MIENHLGLRISNIQQPMSNDEITAGFSAKSLLPLLNLDIDYSLLIIGY